MFVVPGQRPRTVAIAPQAGTAAPIGLIKKGQHGKSDSLGSAHIVMSRGLPVHAIVWFDT